MFGAEATSFGSANSACSGAIYCCFTAGTAPWECSCKERRKLRNNHFWDA